VAMEGFMFQKGRGNSQKGDCKKKFTEGSKGDKNHFKKKSKFESPSTKEAPPGMSIRVGRWGTGNGVQWTEEKKVLRREK